MSWRLRMSAAFLLLAVVLPLNGGCGAAPEPNAAGDAPGVSQAEVDAFVADWAARPEAEQREQLEALIAQLPPDAAEGDPARAKRLLLAALDRGGNAVSRVDWTAWPEKCRPIALEALNRGTVKGRTAGVDILRRLLAKPDRIDWFRPALPALRKTVVSDDHNLRAYTVYALRQMGADGAQCLMAALVNTEGFHTDTARFLADYPDVVIPELQKALKAGDPMRRNALELLKRIAPEGKEMVSALLPLLDEKDPTTRAAAAFDLGLYGSAARGAVPRLLELLVDDEVCGAASRSLGKIGIEADQIERLWAGVVRIEQKTASYPWSSNYGYAAASPGCAAVPELTKALSHPDARVRRAACYACACLGPVAASAALPLLKTASDTDGETARAAIWALGNMGSAAAPAAEGLLATFEGVQVLASRRMGSPSYFGPPAARALADIGPGALPALYKGLASEDIMVQAGCARALAWMDPAEAQGATPHLLKLFDTSDNGFVRRIAVIALVALRAEPKELLPRLRPLARRPAGDNAKVGDFRDWHWWNLATIATWYVEQAEKGTLPGVPLPDMTKNGQYPYAPARFSWGRPEGGLQVGVFLPPPTTKHDDVRPDVERLLIAVRNVGDRPVVLPIGHSQVWGLDVRLAEVPDVLSPLWWSFKYPPGLRELRPGQLIVDTSHWRLAYGRRTAAGRWTKFRPEDREYHLTVTLRGLNQPDPPHLPCYASPAIRKECWQGEATSGTIAVRLDSAYQRERAKRSAQGQ